MEKITTEDLFNTIFAVSEEMNKIKCVSNEINNYFSLDIEENNCHQLILFGFSQHKILFDIMMDYLHIAKNQLNKLLKHEKLFIENESK